MNDRIFSNSFQFRTIKLNNSHYTDNRAGAPSHYFAYMLKGKAKIVSDKDTVCIKDGDFFYIPDKLGYRSYWSGEPEIKFISLGFKYLPNFEDKSYPVQLIEYDKKSAELFLKISFSSAMDAVDVGRFYTLVARLLPKMYSYRANRDEEIVFEVKRYMINNPNASVHEIAKECAISDATLYSAFKKASDMTPNSFRNSIMLEKAKEMIVATDKSIEHISDLLEFSSVSYFRKKFKAYFNITPTEMRKKYRI